MILLCFRAENEDLKGIPAFWLTIFKNVGMLADMVQEHDEPILTHLNDIKVKFLKSNPMVSNMSNNFYILYILHYTNMVCY